MAWSLFDKYGLLDRWQERLNQQLYSFHQVADGYEDFTPTVWIQRERGELAAQLTYAHDTLAYWLGYSPTPVYRTAVISVDRYESFDNQRYELPQAEISAFGRRAVDLIEADVSVSYSDRSVDTDAIDDIGTVTVSTSEITDGVLGFFFRVADGATEAAVKTYRLTPTEISYSGGAYTVTFPRARLVKPSAQAVGFINGDPRNRNNLDVNDDSNFVTAIDAYRVYTDTSLQAEVLSEPYTVGQVGPQTTAATPYLTEARPGEIMLARQNAISEGDPYAVRVYYLEGKPYANAARRVGFGPLETAIVRLARAGLPIDAKSVAYRVSNQWKSDIQYAIEDSNGNPVMAESNPLGQRRVDLDIWRTIRTYANDTTGRVLDYYAGTG